jgi:hypothetical protein
MNSSPFNQKGARECRAPVRPQPRVRRMVVEMHTSIHSEFTGSTRHSRTQWFTAYTSSPRRSGFVASVASRKLSARLGASVEASGPHDFAVRKKAPSSEARPASTASHPASVTIAIRPFWLDETEADMPVIWVGMKAKIFLAMGMDSGDHTKSSPSGAGFFIKAMISEITRQSINVVPANAGIHSHRRRWSCEVVEQRLSQQATRRIDPGVRRDDAVDIHALMRHRGNRVGNRDRP